MVAVGLLALILIAAMTASGQPRPIAEAGSAAGAAADSSAGSPAKSQTSKADKKAKPSKRPTAAKVPSSGPRQYRAAKIKAAPKGKRGALITYSVRVQRGLPYDPDQVARFIHAVLNDPRSWGRSGDWRLKLVGPDAKADISAYLVTRTTTDRLCAPLETEGRVSCFNNHRVVLNADRWAYGAKSYGKDVTGYRRNVVNHEFGHALGHDHVGCPRKGKLAPIMMQQTKGLHGCKKNPWPYPKG
ncbi:MAG TPA: DUF3152 domain-containing protein [Microlunatus sp.]